MEILDSSPGAGPSRLGSCSPSIRPVAGPPLPPKPEESRPAFEGVPEFKPPPTWPNIINTALDLDQEYDDGVNANVDGNSDNDADSQHPGMFDEDVLDDGSDPEAEVPAIEQPEPENLGHMRGGSIDLTMEWDEGDDEGMGMEEPDDYDDPPERSYRRPRKGVNGKVGKCPVCSKSMKGKKENVRVPHHRTTSGTDIQIVEQHINACLDSTGKDKQNRPITSIGHTFSPAPSSPSPPPETPQKGPNAFSVLMSGHKEKAEWKTAEDDLKRDGKRTYGRRPAPFYKVCVISLVERIRLMAGDDWYAGCRGCIPLWGYPKGHGLSPKVSCCLRGI